MISITKFVSRAGRWGIQTATGIADFFSYSVRVFTSVRYIREVKFRTLYTTIVNQVLFTGVHALSLIVVVALLLGGTVIIQAMKNFPKFGIEEFVGNLLVIIIARELGPLATAVIVVSRSGSAIAAEVATAKQNQEIRSFELMGIDTNLFIIVPRIIASIIAIFSLIVFFDIVAFVGGYIIALTTVFIPLGQFAEGLLLAFNVDDLVLTILKACMYGVLIPLICCYYGLKPNSTFQIPIFVSKAVVWSILVVFIINAALSALFYL